MCAILRSRGSCGSIEAADLRALIERERRTRFRRSQITLCYDLAGNISPLHLRVDAQWIEQVLRNLISNALCYTPAGARVTVKLARAGTAARVKVSETGPGIPADAWEHVFERFGRGDKSRSRALGVQTWGSPLPKQWIEAHGGQIGVTSPVGVAAAHPLRDGIAPTLQGGTTFWFTLPL